MNPNEHYIEVNKQAWNKRTELHIKSDFYKYDEFVAGANSLTEIELGILGDLTGKRILHLQCHFGQDSISLARLGAHVTAVDFSDQAIKEARILNEKCGTDVTFVCCDLYGLPDHLEGKYDLVFTSYGTIGWLPDLDKWARVVSHYLDTGGELLIVDFHPVAWMYDNDLTAPTYSYFNGDAIVEEEQGSYADPTAKETLTSVCWNHATTSVINDTIKHGLQVKAFNEYDFTPYDIFPGGIEVGPRRYQVEKWKGIVPLVFALHSVKV